LAARRPCHGLEVTIQCPKDHDDRYGVGIADDDIADYRQVSTYRNHDPCTKTICEITIDELSQCITYKHEETDPVDSAVLYIQIYRRTFYNPASSMTACIKDYIPNHSKPHYFPLMLPECLFLFCNSFYAIRMPTRRGLCYSAYANACSVSSSVNSSPN